MTTRSVFPVSAKVVVPFFFQTKTFELVQKSSFEKEKLAQLSRDNRAYKKKV